MASAQTKPNRLLRELLKQEQEPFTLEAYLSERGYVKSRSKSSSCNLQRSQKGLKSLCKKLLVIGKSLSIKNCNDKDGEKDEDKSYIPLPSDDSKSFNPREDEVPTDRKLRGSGMRDSKNHQRSLLNDKGMAKNREDSQSIPRTLKNKKVTEDSISSGLRDLVLAKRILQQNKKLMFDCVREIIENHGMKEARFGDILGPEEIGKLICQKAREWGKRSGNETNTNKLLNLDFQESIEEWNGLEKQKRELAIAIGDRILEELEKELVMDMVDLSPSPSHLHHIYNI